MDAIPITGAMSGYASEAEAVEMWRNIKGNEELAVVGVWIGLGGFKPAAEAVAWVIVSKALLP